MHTVGDMAESAPPRAKKTKRSAPVSRVSAGERAKQFRDDLYADGGVLFCKYSAYSVGYTRVDTIKDHLKSKKHCAKKCSQQSKETVSGAVAGPSTSTLSSIVKSIFERRVCVRLHQALHACRHPPA